MVGQRYFDSLPYQPFFELLIADAFATNGQPVVQCAPVQRRLQPYRWALQQPNVFYILYTYV